VLDDYSDRSDVDDDGRNVNGEEIKSSQEIGASCAITVTTTTRQAT